MTLHLRPCAGRCGRHLPAAGPRRCPHCSTLDNHRRHQRQAMQGKNTAHWQQIRTKAIDRDRACLNCGNKTNLTVHMQPDSPRYPRHDIATLDDVLTLCSSCHGSIDAPRSTPGVKFP